MNILVTGGTGLVGKALQRNIIDKKINNWYFLSSKETDLRNVYHTDLFFNNFNPDIVIHLASVVLGSTSNEKDQFKSFIDNSHIHTNIFQCCQKYNVRKIITCLTTAMSPNFKKVSVDSILQGPKIDYRSHYGYIHSKRLLHSLSIAYQKAGYGRIILLCPTNIFGMDDLLSSDRLIPSMYRRLRDKKTDFRLSKNFVLQPLWNEDLAKIIINYVDSNNYKTDKPIIIANSEKVSIKYIINTLSEVFGFDMSCDFKHDIIDNREIITNLPIDFKFTPFINAVEYIKIQLLDKKI